MAGRKKKLTKKASRKKAVTKKKRGKKAARKKGTTKKTRGKKAARKKAVRKKSARPMAEKESASRSQAISDRGTTSESDLRHLALGAAARRLRGDLAPTF